MDSYSIDELSIPASLEEPGGADFISMTRLCNQVEAEVLGSYDLAYEPAELLPEWQDPYQLRRILLARAGGAIVGSGTYEAPIEEGSAETWLNVQMHPGFRRRGIGSALYDRLAAFAVADHRSTLQAYVLHSPVRDPSIPSPTGFGAVPRDAPETAFLLARGYALEQVERASRLALPLGAGVLSAHLEAAGAAAGSDYRTCVWEGATPGRWQGGLALLRERMSTDAPSAGMAVSEERWDAQRLRTVEDLERSSPRSILTAAVEHLPSGTLVAFNQLSVPPESGRAVDQRDTLVLREHRGRRLGMLVKATNLIHLDRTHPGHPSVMTFNAEENRHMLRVNEALGFVAVGYGGGWKRLTAGGAR